MNIQDIIQKYAETAEKLDFEPRTHTYTYEGQRIYAGKPVVSVTQFLGIIKNKNYEGISEHYRNNAALIGSMVHAVTEAIDIGAEIDEYQLAKDILFINGYLTHESSTSDIEYYIDLMCSDIEKYKKTYVDGIEFYGIKNYAQEVKVFNKELVYAGTIDRFATINDEPFLIDIKTSKKIEPVARLQLIAYGMCRPSLADKIQYAVLQLKREDNIVQFNLEKYSYDEYFERVVRSAREVYDFAVLYGLV